MRAVTFCSRNVEYPKRPTHFDSENEEIMTKPRVLFAIALLAVLTLTVRGQDASPLKLVQTIPMPHVQDRLDHLGADVPGKRLFIAALGDKQNTVEVVDLKSNQRTASIPGQSKPQGVFYSVDYKKLFVANGTDGTYKIFAGDTLKPINSFPVGEDADHVGYDPATKYLYIGTGDAKSGALVIVDTRTGAKIGEIKTEARPGGIKFDKSNPQIYVTLTGTSRLGVLDRKKREEVTAWAVPGVPGNVALAIDEKHHRLFAGSRMPPLLSVLDTDTGKTIAQIEGVDGIDDLWYDAAHQRIYASGGRGFDVGFVYIYQQTGADQYKLAGKIPTAPGAGTSLWVPEFNRFFVAAPASDKQQAQVLVFEPQQ
jgi:DNA-binding beta-propeller fold protein YncE